MKKLSFSTKLWCLIILLLLAMGSIVAVSIRSINGILTANTSYSEAAEHEAFVIEKEVDHLKWIGKINELFVGNASVLDVQLDHTQCGLGKFLYGEEAKKLAQSDPKIAQILEDIKKPHNELHESGKLIKDVWRPRHEGLRNMLKDLLDDHRKWAAMVSQMVIDRKSDIDVQLDAGLCAFGKFLAGAQYAALAQDFPALKEALEAVKEPHAKLHASAKEIKELLRSESFDAAAQVFHSATLPQLDEVEKYFKKAIAAEDTILRAQANAHQILDSRTEPALLATQEKLKELKNAVEETQIAEKGKMVTLGSMGKRAVTVVSVIALFFGVFLSAFLIRAITRPIRRITGGLAAGADQVAAASGQISTASQQLAEGASEQAAALEETSSSMEEMTATTKQNADNARQADLLMSETMRVVVESGASMDELTSAMQEISKASEDTSKIIKTIDEIAFQTNLLALNAAVEAARAGEAGAGFAVVADEVRNLAMRAAEAAKNTAAMIDDTVKKTKAGSQLVIRTNTAFSSVAERAKEVAELVGDIAAASLEQSQGAEQISRAVAEMDKVVQQNAANAEESASASEEMNAQAEQMNSIVTELQLLIDGGTGDRVSPKRDHKSQWKIAKTESGNGTALSSSAHNGRNGKESHNGDIAHTSLGGMRPFRHARSLPLEDEDRREF